MELICFGFGRGSADFNRIKDINTNCLDQFNAHWNCLEDNNQRLFECRGPEQKLNSCVFEKLVCFPPRFLRPSLEVCLSVQRVF